MDKGNFFITGIQQIGVGTTSVYDAWKWYIDIFGVDIRILEDDTVAERMLPYTGGQPQKRHAAIAMNLQGGGGFEIWQYSDRKPQPVDFQIQVGDLGIFCAKVKCRNVVKAHAYVSAKWDKVSPIVTAPDGSKTFYITDPAGNWFQAVQDDYLLLDEGKDFGGMLGCMIGVSDIDKALKVYSDILGYKVKVFDVKGKFDDLAPLAGGSGEFRRVMLKWNEPNKGAFAPIFPTGYIELVQSLDREPRKIYEGRYWGDPGFIQICYDVTGMDELAKWCAENGHPFTVDSCPDGKVFNMGDASGRFTYIEDPDGTLIEFVETYRISVAKKLNWYISLLKRNREKPLSKLLFRAMKMNRKKFDR